MAVFTNHTVRLPELLRLIPEELFSALSAETGVDYSINFPVSLIPYVIIGNWLYYKTSRNMLLVVLFHLLAGYSNEIFQTHPDSKIIQTVLLLIFSTVLVWKEKAFFFDKSHEKIFNLNYKKK